MEQQTSQPTLLTATQFAKAAQLSYATVLRLLKRKKLSCLPHCRHKRIPVTELERWKLGDFK